MKPFALVRRHLVVALATSWSLAEAQVLNPGTSANGPAGDTLVNIIRGKQKRYVRESWGERASECFTDRDLDKFLSDQIPKKVVAELATDTSFQGLVKTVHDLPPPQQDEILERGTFTYKPTWAQIGKIDRSGQTEAGQQAEKEIAKAIVAALKPSR